MQIRSVGIDLGKTTFHLVALDDNGKVLLKKKFTQRQLITLTANLQTSLIGMEACGGAHFLGRALRAQGHDMKLIPAQTDRGGLGSEGSYGVDLEDPGSKTPPISVHWQNACQSSTSNNWSKLPATYQISFVLAGPQSALDEVSRKNASVAPSVNPGPVCNRSDTPGPPPGQCAIECLTATWNGHTVGAGNTLVIPVGSKATVAWTTANCGAGAAIGLEAINGTGAAEIWTKNNLAAQGSIGVAPTDDVTTYLMGASDTKSRSMNDIESAKVLIQLTTTGAATCSGCQWYYFQLNSPAGSNPECFTYAAYGTLAQAQAEAQAQATNYTVKQITAEQYYAGCSS